MTFDITTGSADDLDRLRPLWLGMVEHHHALIGDRIAFLDAEESWSRRRGKYARWLEDPGAFLLLASVGDLDGLAGYAFCTVESEGANSTFDLGPSCGDVESLAVAPEARGHGVGTALLAEAKRRFVLQGCGVWAIGVMEANTRAAALYERVGFRSWERQMLAPLPVGAPPRKSVAPEPPSTTS